MVMRVVINKPSVPRVQWTDIKPGFIFSWGDAVVWYIKVSHTGMLVLGDPAQAFLIDAQHLRECSTLRVASKVEITP